MLGPDCVLVRRTRAGYRCIPREEAVAIQKFLIGGEGGAPDRLFDLSCGMAEALNDGKVALAQIYGLRIPIAGLGDGQITQLAAAAPFIKANFNPDEPRDAQGRWTDEGGAEGESFATPLAPPIAASTVAAGETGASFFGPVGRTALAGLADLAAGSAAPTAFLGVLFLPTNSKLIYEGVLPGRPDLGYRYDQDTGVLEINRQSTTGQQLVVAARVGTDGLFRDADGRVVGRSLGSIAAVDADALPTAVGHIGAEAGTAAASSEDRPKLAPIQAPKTSAAAPSGRSPTSSRSPACRRGSKSSSTGCAMTTAARLTAPCSKPKGPAMQIRWTRRVSGKIGLGARDR